MTYITKELENGTIVGLTHGEIVLPVSSVRELSDKEIAEVVKDLVADYEYLKEFFGGGDLTGMTIQEAREYVKRQRQSQKTNLVKRNLVKRRRREFNARRAQLMLALIDRDDYICQHPGCEVQEDLTIDHKVPLSRGGSDRLENLQLLCRKHNSQKGDRAL